MKYLLTILITLFTLTANAQDIFIGADMVHSFDEAPSVKFGAEYESTRLFVGYAKYHNRASFFEFGVGLFKNTKIGSAPVHASIDLRAILGGTKQVGNVEYGIAYSGFLGYRFNNFSMGTSIEHIVLDEKFIYINPLSIRLSL